MATIATPWGSFKNYVEKMRWVGCPKNAFCVHIQDESTDKDGFWDIFIIRPDNMKNQFWAG